MATHLNGKYANTDLKFLKKITQARFGNAIAIMLHLPYQTLLCHRCY